MRSAAALSGCEAESSPTMLITAMSSGRCRQEVIDGFEDLPGEPGGPKVVRVDRFDESLFADSFGAAGGVPSRLAEAPNTLLPPTELDHLGIRVRNVQVQTARMLCCPATPRREAANDGVAVRLAADAERECDRRGR
jgi:hypothetical protein